MQVRSSRYEHSELGAAVRISLLRRSFRLASDRGRYFLSSLVKVLRTPYQWRSACHHRHDRSSSFGGRRIVGQKAGSVAWGFGEDSGGENSTAHRGCVGVGVAHR
jgi:hypothetical protein